MFKYTILALIISTAAMGADIPRTIDMTQVIHDARGGVVKDSFEATKDDPDCAKCHNLTLGRAVWNALHASFQDEQGLSAMQKWARGALGDRVWEDKAAILTAGELARVKALVGRLYSPVVIAAVYPLIDPNDKPPTVE